MSTNNAINKKTGGLTVTPIGTSPGETGEIKFQELIANGNNHVAIKAPDSLDASSTYILPSALPTGNRVLQSDATGQMSWASGGGGGGGGSLEDLSDVTIVNPQSGEALRYDGSEWKNQAIPVVAAPKTLEFYSDGGSLRGEIPPVNRAEDVWVNVAALRLPDNNGTNPSVLTVFSGDGQSLPTKKRRNTISRFIIREDGTLWGTGSNYHGQLGIGSATGSINNVSLTQINSDTDWKEVFSHFHAPEVTFAIKNDGTLWSWGFNANGATGHGATSGNTLIPTQVGSDDDWLDVIPLTTGNYNNASSQFGSTSVVALKTDGTLWSWGSNAFGLTGQGTASGNTTTPTQIGSDNDWVAVEPFSASTAYNNTDAVGCYVALKSDHTLWSWGSNTHFMTGQGTASGNTLTPTQMGVETDFVKIIPMCGYLHTGRHSTGTTAPWFFYVQQYALKDNGELYAWGAQASNTATYTLTTPTRIGANNDLRASDLFAITSGAEVIFCRKPGNSFWYYMSPNFNNPASGSLGTAAAFAGKFITSKPSYCINNYPSSGQKSVPLITE